jgi:hypothetical protein
MGQTGRNALMPTITYNIPAGVQADFLDALRDKYGAPNATALQLQALVEKGLKEELRDTYRHYMRKKPFDVVLD